MRILFVCGSTDAGGSTRSTIELAHALADRSVPSAVLFARHRGVVRKRVNKRAHDLAAARPRFAGLARPLTDELGRGRRARDREPDRSNVPQWDAYLPENALPRLLRDWRPELVVANSVRRLGWRQIVRTCHAAGVPVALYLREESSLMNLDGAAEHAFAVVANSHALSRRAAGMGFDAPVVPSVIDLTRSRVESSRERVLYVNPVPEYGVDIAVAIAQQCPEVAFTFAESWILRGAARRELDARVAGLANVEVRSRNDDPSALYRDTSVLLAPYRPDNRPRVVLEAQANGIPVVASDVPALREAIGEGGRVVSLDASVEAWARTLREVLDPSNYPRLCDAARRHAERPEVRNDHIVDSFLAVASSATRASLSGERS